MELNNLDIINEFLADTTEMQREEIKSAMAELDISDTGFQLIKLYGSDKIVFCFYNLSVNDGMCTQVDYSGYPYKQRQLRLTRQGETHELETEEIWFFYGSLCYYSNNEQ